MVMWCRRCSLVVGLTQHGRRKLDNIGGGGGARGRAAIFWQKKKKGGIINCTNYHERTTSQILGGPGPLGPPPPSPVPTPMHKHQNNGWLNCTTTCEDLLGHSLINLKSLVAVSNPYHRELRLLTLLHVWH